MSVCAGVEYWWLGACDRGARLRRFLCYFVHRNTCFDAMPNPDSLLDRIPNELLGMIKKCYDDDDLVGHVNFFQLTARTAAFYPNPGPLWEKLCRVNGLGRLPGREVETQTIDWFYIARECAAHAVECKHPGCGTARMTENGKPS